jgi:hypothetical protein
VFPKKYRGSARRARGLNTIVEQKYETLPLPCPVALRGVSIRKYRGSSRRTRGLKQKAYKFQEQTLRRKFNYAINQKWQDHTFA